MSSAGSRRVYKALLKERLVASVSDTCIKLNVSAVPFEYGEHSLVHRTIVSHLALNLSVLVNMILCYIVFVMIQFKYQCQSIRSRVL